MSIQPNKQIIWITLTVSVLLHLLVLTMFHDFNFHSTPSNIKHSPKVLTLTINSTPKVTQPKLDPSIPKEKPLKNTQIQKKKHKKEDLPKPNKEVSQSKEEQGPATSKKQKENDLVSEKGGDRQKGQLKAKKQNNLAKNNLDQPQKTKKEKATTKESTSVTKNTSGYKATAESSSNQVKPTQKPTEANTSENKSAPSKSTPSKSAPKVASTPQKNQKPLKKQTIRPIKKASGKISFAQQEDTDSLSKNNTSKNSDSKKKTNPLFDAINQAQPASSLSSYQIGKLTELEEGGLKETRLGDPLSSFEHKQRRVYNVYLAKMSEQVNEHWQEPESNRLLLTRVKLYLSLEGFIKDIYIEQSSGNITFDNEAIRAIKAVKQFEMPPSRAAAGYLTKLTMTVDNYTEPDE